MYPEGTKVRFVREIDDVPPGTIGTGVERTKPSPLWHVRYIDDAVCGRFELPDSRAVWEAMQDCYRTHGVRMFMERRSPEWLESFTELGRAILRARETDAETIARLRAELKEARSIHCEGCESNNIECWRDKYATDTE
jgi:hypothetical protein